MPRDKTRIKPLLEKLEKIWNKNPDLRLTQLLHILALNYSDYKGKDTFYLEDSLLDEAADKHMRMHNIK
jgi:uncharacterized protein YihD (DUF1040 family)